VFQIGVMVIIDLTGRNIPISHAFRDTIVDPDDPNILEYRLVNPGQRKGHLDIEIYTDWKEIEKKDMHARRLLLTVNGSFRDPLNGKALAAMASHDNFGQ
jgi:hypothetical protein